MKTVAELCTQFEDLSPEDRDFAFNRLVLKAVNSCSKYVDEPEVAIEMFGVFLCAALVADDKISKGEFEMLSTKMKELFGEKSNMKKCKELANEMMSKREFYKTVAETLAKTFHLYWDRKDRETIILCCIAVCGIDGVISQEEEDWLNMLVESVEAY